MAAFFISLPPESLRDAGATRVSRGQKDPQYFNTVVEMNHHRFKNATARD
jgi:hypothetical protein